MTGTPRRRWHKRLLVVVGAAVLVALPMGIGWVAANVDGDAQVELDPRVTGGPLEHEEAVGACEAAVDAAAGGEYAPGWGVATRHQVGEPYEGTAEEPGTWLDCVRTEWTSSAHEATVEVRAAYKAVAESDFEDLGEPRDLSLPHADETPM